MNGNEEGRSSRRGLGTYRGLVPSVRPYILRGSLFKMVFFNGKRTSLLNIFPEGLGTVSAG